MTSRYYDGSTIEMDYVAEVEPGATPAVFHLYDGARELGRVGVVDGAGPVRFMWRYTPTPGRHKLSIGSVDRKVHGAFLRITRV